MIRGVRWAPRESIVRKARGSDTWPLTWADDDALYTAYGDGRGFEPFIPEKLSLGFARVVGTPDDFTGINIRSATGEQKGDGARGKKASGMLMVGGVLYLWVRNAGNSQLAWSSDHATDLDVVRLAVRDELRLPDLPELRQGLRRSQGRLRLRLLAGWRQRLPARRPHGPGAECRRSGSPTGRPTSSSGAWEETGCRSGRRTSPHAGRSFSHPGGCYRSSISYDAGLKRYLWCQTLPGGDARFRGGFGIYDAPEPWGPWTTAYFTENWDVGPGETSSLPTKWMSADGRTVHLVFSGDDCFSVRRATLIVDGPSADQ